MKQTCFSLCSLCMAAALCSQMMQGRSYRFAIRVVLGLELFRAAMNLAIRGLAMLN